MNDAQAIGKELGADDVVVIGTKNGNGSDPVVIYTNSFKGKRYFHIRTVWKDDKGEWHPGKGLSIDPANAKKVLEALGKASANF